MAVFLTLSCLLAACEPFDPELGMAREEIIGGSLTLGDPSVVLLHMGDGASVKSSCSGTLISKRVVVTAAHCLDDDWDWVRVYFGSDVHDEEDPAFVGGGVTSDYLVHPAWNPSGFVSDIALLRLESDAPVSPKPWNRSALGPGDEGESIRLVGFGVTNGQVKTGSGKKRTVTTAISDVLATKIRYEGAAKSTCSGDSGGPAFMKLGGVEKLVGITSYGDKACKSYGVNARIDVHADWIDDYIGGAEPSTPSIPIPSPPGSSCAHDICEAGAPLAPGCHPCAAKMCAKDPGCCGKEWDDICVVQVATMCKLAC